MIESEHFGLDTRVAEHRELDCVAAALALHKLTSWSLYCLIAYEVDFGAKVLASHVVVESPCGFFDLAGPEAAERWWENLGRQNWQSDLSLVDVAVRHDGGVLARVLSGERRRRKQSRTGLRGVAGRAPGQSCIAALRVRAVGGDCRKRQLRRGWRKMGCEGAFRNPAVSARRAYNGSMERKIFWMVFAVLGLAADFLLPFWWAVLATLPILYIAWWVAYRSEWFS